MVESLWPQLGDAPALTTATTTPAHHVALRRPAVEAEMGRKLVIVWVAMRPVQQVTQSHALPQSTVGVGEPVQLAIQYPAPQASVIPEQASWAHSTLQGASPQFMTTSPQASLPPWHTSEQAYCGQFTVATSQASAPSQMM